MEIILSASQMALADLEAQKNYGLSGLVLMENAGERIFWQILSMFPDFNQGAFLVGKGNNGGDGLVIARKMAEIGLKPHIFIFAKEEKELSDSCLAQLKTIQALQLNWQWIPNLETYQKIKAQIFSYPYLIDSLLGTGLKSPVRGVLKNLILDLNAHYQGKILAIDLPSGFSGQEEPFEVILKAHTTFAIETLKIGMAHQPFKSFCGHIVKVPIGIPLKAIKSQNPTHFLLEKKDVVLPSRPRHSHKGNFGKTLIIAGSNKYPGALSLSLLAALKTGTGYVYAYGSNNFSSFLPEVIPLPNLPSNLDEFSSIALGPGWVPGDKKLLEKLLLEFSKPLILDAHALNLLSSSSSLLKNRDNLLLTPHLKEFSLLTSFSVKEIQKNPFAALRKFSNQYPNIALLLKDSFSILKWKENFYTLPWGNSGLAKAGSGDLLTGLIAGFASYLSLKEAVFLAHFINGRTAEILSKQKTHYAYSASLLPQNYFLAFKELENFSS